MSVHVPGLGDDRNSTINGLIRQLDQLSHKNRTKSLYYESKKMVRKVGLTLPPQYQNLGLTLGWASKAVDGLTNRVNLNGFSWPGGDLTAAGLDDIIDENRLLSELALARTDSALHGVAFLIATAGDDGEPDALSHVKSALDGTGEWDSRRRMFTSFLSVNERKGREIVAFTFYEPGETHTCVKDRGVWTVDSRNHAYGMLVDALPLRPHTSKRMGHSRITLPVMRIQDAAIRALLRLEAHADIYAIPKLIAMGADSSVFRNQDGSPSDEFQLVMGRWFGIPDDDGAVNPRVDVKQFSADSPEGHLKALNVQARLMAREADLPVDEFTVAEASNPTSEGSYIASRENLIARAESAADDWSVPIRSHVARLLAIKNGEPVETFKSVQTRWRNPRFLSRSAEADAGAKQIASVPWLAETRVGLELLGLTPTQIDDALAQRRKASGRALAEAVMGRGNSDGIASDPGAASAGGVG